MWKKISVLILGGMISLGVLANEAFIRKTIEEKMGARVASVTKTPYLNLFEVYVDGQVLYTDAKVSAIIVGSIIDGKTFANYTAIRMQQLTAINFSDLPLELAIKKVRGNGKRVVASFEDVNCSFCVRLAREMALLTDITHYVFLYPILSQDSLEKSKQVWCSADRAKAWHELMVEGRQPSAPGTCDTSALQKTIELGHRLNVTATPTIFLSSGERISGALPAAELDNRLNQAIQPTRQK